MNMHTLRGYYPWHSPYAESEEEGNEQAIEEGNGGGGGGELKRPLRLHPGVSGRPRTLDPIRRRTTPCSTCEGLFDTRDIKDGVCVWCLYDTGKLPQLDKTDGRKTRVGDKRIKLTESDVLTILILRDEGMTHKQIAAKYGISESSISKICNGDSWKKITSVARTNKNAIVAKGA